MRLSRTVWRHVPAGAEPLHLGWIQLARGRWNTQRPRLACLYTALSQEGALAEYRKHFLHAGLGAAAGALRPRDLVSLHVIVTPVLNLTRPDVAHRLGVDAAMLTGDDAGCMALCRGIARRAVADGFRGILAPSAALARECTLMLYPESQHGHLTVRNGPDRIALRCAP